MNTESGEVGKREDGRRRDQVNRQRLPVPYIFLWHLQHRKQHLLHAATWLYLANSHTAISYSPALYLDQYAFPRLFYLIPLPLLLQSLPFFFHISVVFQFITIRDHKLLPPVNTHSQKSISKGRSRICYRTSTCFLLGFDCKSQLFL